MNMQALMKQAQTMQKEITYAQNVINETEFIGTSALVTIKLKGTKEVLNVKIENADDVKEDLTILEDMIVIAFNDAIKKIDIFTQEKMGKYANMMPGIF